ncbi:hypothetical protein HOC32_04805 [Candidatus Woesearchaeota archaeon]|nr:hypothetical protein [Candidatus Woesearchaeota archaeon]
MGKNGFKTLPSYRKLVKLRKHSLANAINRYHGTFPEFRRILGEKQKRREDNIWQDLDYTIEQARTVMKENGFETLPSGPKLRVLGYSSLGAAIYKHHGGFPTFRKILGEEQLRKKRGIWQNRDYAIEQARKVMDENGFDKLPSQEKLNELGYSSLASSIHKYHGGFPTFRIYINEYNLNLKQSMGESQDG